MSSMVISLFALLILCWKLIRDCPVRTDLSHIFAYYSVCILACAVSISFLRKNCWLLCCGSLGEYLFCISSRYWTVLPVERLD